MFQIGDLILYGNTGVCRVDDIKPLDFSAEEGEQLYYILQPLYQTCTISTPVEGGRVFMRPVISRQEAERLIDLIPTVQAEAFQTRALRELNEHYQASISSHSCQDLIEMTMSIYAKKLGVEKSKRKFGSVDERFMKRAEELLFGELGAALGIDRDAVPGYIQKRVGTMQKNAEQVS